MCEYCEQLKGQNGECLQEPIIEKPLFVQIMSSTPISKRHGIGAILDVYHVAGNTYSHACAIPINYCPMCGRKLD